jgi:hypothetical protein
VRVANGAGEVRSAAGGGVRYNDEVQAADGIPFTAHLHVAREYVMSRSLTDTGAWRNSALPRGVGGPGV